MGPPDRKGSAARFPSPKERERIMRRRKQLSYALSQNLALRSFDPAGSDARTADLVREYGADEVRRMIARIGRQLNRPKGSAEEPWLYADYVARYRRFGGSRPLLSFAEQQALNEERAMLLMRDELRSGALDFSGLDPLRAEPLSADEKRRLAALSDLLLADADLWDDLVPEDPPAVLPPLPAVPEPDDEPLATPSPAQAIDDLVEQGHRLLRERKTAEACDRWLEAWALVRRLARPAHRTATAFSWDYELLYPLDHWDVDLVWELGNAGIDDPVYGERQLHYSREYLAQFPDSEPNTVVNMLRAQGEALWRSGRRPEAEAVYQSLVTQLPDEEWGYIGWADQYWLFRPKDSPSEYAAGEHILQRALARPTLKDREYVLERLAKLYGEWGRPEAQARTAAQLAQLREERERRPQKPVAITAPRSAQNPAVIAAPRSAPAKKPGRNEPCWCGSGRKYKHCHLQSDS